MLGIAMMTSRMFGGRFIDLGFHTFTYIHS